MWLLLSVVFILIQNSSFRTGALSPAAAALGSAGQSQAPPYPHSHKHVDSSDEHLDLPKN